MAGPDRMPIPSLLITGAVHQHLLQTKQRLKTGIFIEAGDAREVRVHSNKHLSKLLQCCSLLLSAIE
jgi:hypothetical protein